MEPTTVTLRFTPLPVHVRTARLVSAAVARRSGVSEDVLDEVRLAVGEACSRAVDLHGAHRPDAPVTLRLTDATSSFTVEVVDLVPQGTPPVPRTEVAAIAAVPALGEDDDPVLAHGVGLAVIAGLVDDVHFGHGQDGLTLRMTWPLTGDAPGRPGARQGASTAGTAQVAPGA
ncbi:anti-sigma regulatory factor (Ser/Thr protein kinase) [Motilibacter rhizosphaerae]|uniref:Anti-sigma regulatory factor (Ser/Thr protein kinase) n=1 Tax=Motilibacter rhizosphaerae TaxID=598652 RepID=A0A4V2F2R7_9ACTN|nr:ATP-binding protein [Motilibacter rhizosphaerae]RZS79396.1 anti-sigma regulatory factor (Ser/Thr protein kinase) [Motilibacter rhizosphaerae]